VIFLQSTERGGRGPRGVPISKAKAQGRGKVINRAFKADSTELQSALAPASRAPALQERQRRTAQRVEPSRIVDQIRIVPGLHEPPRLLRRPRGLERLLDLGAPNRRCASRTRYVRRRSGEASRPAAATKAADAFPPGRRSFAETSGSRTGRRLCKRAATLSTRQPR
jgi:hypothetical protein